MIASADSTTPARAASTSTGALVFPDLRARRNVREQVAHALRAALIAGQMRPGVVYSAPALAAEFGVSATPVREAMLDMVKEGLVSAVRNKGFRVTELSDRELDEISQIRSLIEPPIVADIARHYDPRMKAQTTALRRTAKGIVKSARSGQLVDYIELDRQFHLGLLGFAGNAHLVEVVSDLRARSRLYGLQKLADEGRLTDSAREHEQLLDLVAAGDAEAAEALMARHIGHVRGRWASGEPS